MTKIIPVASGKGGVGKTSFVANIGYKLSSLGKTVILIDLDLGGSNLHTCLGVKNTGTGIGSFINKREKDFSNLIVETPYDRLYLIPGDALYAGTANLPFPIKKKIIDSIQRDLVADFIFIDLGSGTSYNTVDFYLAAYSGIIVTVPETPSILNAYSFLKNALYRLLYLGFPAKSPEREYISNFFKDKIEGTNVKFKDLVTGIELISLSSSLKIKKMMNNFYPRVVLNRIEASEEIAMCENLMNVVKNNINIPIEFIGFVPFAKSFRKSVNNRIPFVDFDKNSKLNKYFEFISGNLIKSPVEGSPYIYDDIYDMIKDQSKFIRK
ncbi:MinD/ParA family protein [Candidatus Borreliella tachyglossi]|uniref:MinD/ParA family protein n=1 Tax=Candidatus Borreliella tachyglossi TaxID=1964448 RepID=A0A2S1LXQ5_9SPIR|nr:P-loop NTPase [Candidatus Borreliella tachyglossi]AWG43078.1 MinD/ParA family protein [Candidatus Borreliella tachyglossi]